MFTQLLESCWKATKESVGIEASRHELQIGMSFIPEGRSQKDITKNFAEPWRLRSADELGMCGVILYTSNGTIVVDRAAANPQAMFAKIVHRFDGKTSFPEMLKKLYDDELWLADVLGLELE